tara:strand:+ start:291 stop:440 length:150 start_codon:yes stop_codon:yes gene_type:complete
LGSLGSSLEDDIFTPKSSGDGYLNVDSRTSPFAIKANNWFTTARKPMLL